MKKETLYIWTVLVFVISCVVPAFCSDSVGSYLSLAATLLAAFCTLMTLVIAIMLYDRFSLERELAGRQFEEVLKLKEGILSHGMPFFWKDEDAKVHTTWISPNGQLPEVPVHLLDNRRLLWSHNAFTEYFDCNKVNPMLLPNEVYACYNRMPVHGWGLNTPELTIHDAVGYIGTMTSYPKRNDEVRLYEDINFNNTTIRELCENYARLNKAVDIWLNEHNVYKMMNKDRMMTLYGKDYPEDFKGRVDIPEWAKETYTNWVE